MAIINLTPDSFYERSRNTTLKGALERTSQVLKQGANIIDFGAYSSRPGARHISEEEEWERLEPVLKSVREKYPDAIISIDTFRSEIARKAIERFEVDMINDISAGEMSNFKMFRVIADYHVPYIIMHMSGTPQTMQSNPQYTFLMKEIAGYFASRIERLKAEGVSDIIIDPGFGFGKTLEHNYELLNRLDDLKILELPMLVGLSRKSMIYKFLGKESDEALNGTTVLHTIALTKGASILRVHDVPEAVETIRLVQKTLTAGT